MARENGNGTIKLTWGDKGEHSTNFEAAEHFRPWPTLAAFGKEVDKHPERALEWLNMIKRDRAFGAARAKAETYGTAASKAMVMQAAAERVASYNPFETAIRSGAPVRASAFTHLEAIMAENPSLSFPEARKEALARAQKAAQAKRDAKATQVA